MGIYVDGGRHETYSPSTGHIGVQNRDNGKIVDTNRDFGRQVSVIKIVDQLGPVVLGLEQGGKTYQDGVDRDRDLILGRDERVSYVDNHNCLETGFERVSNED